jgi:zona occludens toxin
MLVFKEGVPGAGKSYDAVVTDILPALASGRKVYARLNGLNHARIAEHLKMAVEDVERLLVVLDDGAVNGLWKPGAVDADSLVVIDEAHEYYVASRESMNKAVEKFFAEHRHAGLDIVLLSQWYRRLHSAVRARVERKAVFQKLTAVGSEKSYLVTFYHSTGPDRFEKVSSESRRYDKAVFPLYEGVKPGTTNTTVYRAGGKTVWAKIGLYAMFMVPLVLVAFWVLSRFFHGDGGMVRDTTTTRIGGAPVPLVIQPGQVSAAVKPAGSPTMQHGKFDTSKMSPEAAYLFDMAGQARPRLAGFAQVEGGQALGVVEWREDQGHVLERLTLDQVRALGVQVDIEPYGVKLVAGKEAIIVTAWPVDMPGTVPGAGDAQQGEQGGAQSAAGASVVMRGTGGSGASQTWSRGVSPAAYTPPELTSVSAISGN